jgi:uncharacterized membrane protein YdjX (TVP38/TMEM64 family)
MDTARGKWWQSPWFWLAAVAIVAFAGFMLFSPTAKDWLEQIGSWAERIMRRNPVAGAATFFALSAFSSMLAFVSSIVLVPPAVEVYGKTVAFLLLWGGWATGSAITYGIGYFARPLIRRLVSKEKLEKYQHLVSKRTPFWWILVFAFAVPSEIPGYVFGGLHYPLWKYFAAIATAEAVYSIGIVVAGESLMDAKLGVLAVSSGALVAVVVAAVVLLRRRKKRGKGAIR